MFQPWSWYCKQALFNVPCKSCMVPLKHLHGAPSPFNSRTARRASCARLCKAIAGMACMHATLGA